MDQHLNTAKPAKREVLTKQVTSISRHDPVKARRESAQAQEGKVEWTPTRMRRFTSIMPRQAGSL